MTESTASATARALALAEAIPATFLREVAQGVDREVARLEGLRASHGASRQAAFLRALADSWRAAADRLDVDSADVTDAVAVARTYLELHPECLAAS